MQYSTEERVIQYIRKKIQAAKKIVAVLGIEMLVEGGGYDLDTNEETYRVEEEYGVSPEDILSTSFFNAKPERFYRFYKKEILGMHVRSTPAYDALLKLQQQGKLSAVVSQNFHGLPKDISIQNLIEPNGSMYVNHCPRCGKSFSIDYVINAAGIPQCDKCKVAVRPGIRLLGERGDTKLMTEVVNVYKEADVLLILGKNMYNDFFENEDLEHEQLKVLFSKEIFRCEREVDFTIRDEIQVILPIIVE